jgi:hypothetical protein
MKLGIRIGLGTGLLLLTYLWIQERVSPEEMKLPTYVLDEPWESSLDCGSMCMGLERKEQIQRLLMKELPTIQTVRKGTLCASLIS